MEHKTVILKQEKERIVSLKKFMKIILIFIIGIILLLEIFSAYIVMKFSHPIPYGFNKEIKDYGISNYEKVSFSSLNKDVTLGGYLIKCENSNKTMILCHGYGDSMLGAGKYGSSVKVEQAKLAKEFLKQGYNTLVFDFRGHGQYARKHGVTVGFNEQKDLLGAINFIKSKGLGDKIGLMGFSMGAGTSLSVLDKTKDVNFVIADSPFSDLKDYLNSNMKVWTKLPNFPFVSMILMNFKLIYGIDYSSVSPISSIQKTNVPILIIHGKKDTTIPYTESVRMEKYLKNKQSKLFLFDNSSHIGSYLLYGDKYEDVIKDFLNNN